MSETNSTCPDHNYDWPEEIPHTSYVVNFTLLVLHVSYVVVFTIIMVLRRNRFPLRRSGVGTTLLLSYGTLFGSFSNLGRDVYGRYDLSCDAYLWLLMMSFPAVCTPLLTKVSMLLSRIEWSTIVKDLPLNIESATDLHLLQRKRAAIGSLRSTLINSLIYSCILGIILTFFLTSDKYNNGCLGCALQLEEGFIILMLTLAVGIPTGFLLRRAYKKTDDKVVVKRYGQAFANLILFVIIWFLVDWFDPYALHEQGILNWGVIVDIGLVNCHTIFCVIPTLQTFYHQRDYLDLENQGPMNLKDFLSSETGYNAFAQFLALEFSNESVRFWREATRWRMHRSLSGVDAVGECMSAQNLNELFLKEGSYMQVNVSHETRVKVNEVLEKAGDDDSQIPNDLFDDSIEEIFELMQFDAWNRFIASDIYRTYIQSSKMGTLKSQFSTDYEVNSIASSRTGKASFVG